MLRFTPTYPKEIFNALQTQPIHHVAAIQGANKETRRCPHEVQMEKELHSISELLATGTAFFFFQNCYMHHAAVNFR